MVIFIIRYVIDGGSFFWDVNKAIIVIIIIIIVIIIISMIIIIIISINDNVLFIISNSTFYGCKQKKNDYESIYIISIRL